MSQVPRGPVKRQSSMPRSAQASAISVISASESIHTPLPWLIRCTGTSSRKDSLRTIASASGPSTEGISLRQEPPSGKTCGEESAGLSAGAARPSAVRARSPGRRGPAGVGKGAEVSVTGGIP